MALREKILRELEASEGGDVSGQALAEKLGVSRSAVWKAVNALKAEGYDIASSTNKGYRLAPGCDRLDAALIRAGAGVPVYAYASVDSTNSEAKRLLAGGVQPPFAAAAEEQTGGRGRQGHVFCSPRGGLYLSVAMAPRAVLTDAFSVTSYAAVCAAEEIEACTGRSCGIKWVNDLYLDGRKVCGILTEAISDFESGSVGSVIVGLGINLHPAALPEELRDTAGFLAPAAPVKNRLAAALTARLLRYGDRGGDCLDRYRRRCIVIGRQASFLQNGARRSGLVTGIGDDGALLVRTDSGAAEVRGGPVRFEGLNG